MSIRLFLLLGVIFLGLLLVFCIIERRINTKKRKYFFRWIYFILLLLLGWGGISTANKYIYPDDSTVFSNADYHVIKHKGFLIDDSFYLAHGSTSGSEGFREEALWDEKEGVVHITDDAITIQDYNEPLYIKTGSDGKDYVLSNCKVDIDVSNGFELRKGDKFVYSLQIYHHEPSFFEKFSLDEKKSKNITYYISKYAVNNDSIVCDTSSFVKEINQGYSLLDIIAQTPSIDIGEDLDLYFSDCYLVREKINAKDSGYINPGKNESRLLLMPGNSFYYFDDLTINGNRYPNKSEVSVPRTDDMYLFSGHGKNRTDILRLRREGKAASRLEYILPHMKQLRNMDGRVFVTSSIQIVAEDAREGGYLFNIFDSEENFNHINANIRYTVGTPRDSINFCVTDLYSDDPNNTITVSSDEEFLLSTHNKGENSISWIMEMENFRETNPMQWNHIFLFIFVFIVLIGIRILIDSMLIGAKGYKSSLSMFELAAYIVVLSFCTVRLILGWRASTFVPIDDVSEYVFSKMRENVMFSGWTWVVWFVPIICMLYPILHKYKLWNKFVIWYDKVLPFKKENTFVAILFILVLGVLFGLSKISFLNRLCNIPIPIIVYFLFDIWIRHLKEKDNNAKWVAANNAIVMFGYLVLMDAGFSIIFISYLIVYYGVIEVLYRKVKKSKSIFKKSLPPVISIIVCVGLYFVLQGQGEIMIFLFSHISWIISIMMVLSLVMAVVLIKKAKMFLLSAIYILCAVVCLLDITTVYPIITNKVENKAHMRYRAEIQKLEKDKKIDDLIRRNEFGSNDIVSIMRTAHNQWFINQYIKSGKEKDSFFKIQPHSNQGCSYTTQTTDLVVTRYVLAEHNEGVIRLLLAMLVMLVLVFVFEVDMSDVSNRRFVSGALLLYLISMLVFLSATNRIVFVGQDFPMLSLQSKATMIFSMLLLLLPTLRTINIRFTENIGRSSKRGFLLAFVCIPLFTLLSMYAIPQKGMDQNENEQFDLSSIVSDVSDRVDVINARFRMFQESDKATKRMRIIDVWKKYKESEFVDVYDAYLNSTDAEDAFFRSLLDYFDNKQTKLTDPEQLLHLHRRGSICYLAVNKQHYFIPAIMKEDKAWTGGIMTAKEDYKYSLYGLADNDKVNLNTDVEYQTNILPVRVAKIVPNIKLMRFDKDWTCGEEPLLLLTSSQGNNQKEFYSIENDTLRIIGSGSENQLAARIKCGDVFMLCAKDYGKDVKTIYASRLNRSGDNYIAKNIWLNGHRKLFYPLGKESMWSYHFANLVSDAYSNDDMVEYKDSTIRISIDYNLHKKFYELIDDEENSKSKVCSMVTINSLLNFRKLDSVSQQDSKRSDYYYDRAKKCIVMQRNLPYDFQKALESINSYIRRHARDNSEHLLSDAIDFVLERPFDFTAVAIDGDGKIRLLFDYARKRNVDPNNISHLNKLISELYLDGSAGDEREIFGNKALQYIPMGPGSSFKPIAYTAITSQRNLNWENIDVRTDGMNEARHVIQDGEKNRNDSKVKQYDYYGGVDIINYAKESPLNIDGGSGLLHNNYLVKSDNLYHSVMIMMGMQRSAYVTDLFKDASTVKDAKYRFPSFTYNGSVVCFDPDVWFKDRQLHMPDNTMFDMGLLGNYHIQQNTVGVMKNYYANYYGNDSIMLMLYKYKSGNKGWSYAETGSLNTTDRRISPQIRNGFNQVLLGAYPIQLSPLQMAMNAYRLASLNSAENITTLLDDAPKSEYKFFESLGNGWTEESYLAFVRKQVWSQLGMVPKVGTARVLNGLTANLEHKGYYLYCKTGTLNDDRNGHPERDRIKHLLVIITNQKLENISSVEQLKDVKYYAVYLSYMGVSDFSNNRFRKYIEAIVESSTFKSYMND
ncbi:MAG: hypothetical protein J5542_10720 [Bacteroidales bacterium]|nr:hypothetical protein [Bacteroidales bacterium]